MKLFLSLLVSSITLISFGQTYNLMKSGDLIKPEFFLDSVKIDPAITVFDPNKIATVHVEREYDPITFTQGKVYMVSKNPKDYNFVTLDKIKGKYAQNTATPVLFMINSDFVQNNISTFKIDNTYILNVEVLRGIEFEHLKESVPDLVIVRIRTKTKENLEENSKIHIRGLIYP